MARQRYINTKLWDDSYFKKLNPIDKLLFVYYLTNPLANIAGIYEISLERMEFDTGIEIDDIKKILESFEKAGKIIYRCGYIRIVNFIKHQKMNDNIKKGILSIISEIPERVLLAIIDYESLSKTLNYVNVNDNDNVNINFNQKKEYLQTLINKLKGVS